MKTHEDNAGPVEEGREQTVLIIDDDPSSLGIISDYLEDSGFVVLVARNGKSGIERARYAQPDIIFLDVLMPGIDGFETCRRLKSDPATADIPVIFMTALAGTEDKVKGFEAGAVDYITKPFEYREILSRTRMQLRLAALNRELRHTNRELTKHRNRLEELVQERTTEIKSANVRLHDEIAERKRSEEALRVERDRLTSVFEAMEDGVYIVNQDYDIEYVNPVITADFGPPDERKCYAYFHDRETVCPWCKNQDVFAGKTVRWEWSSDKNDRTYDLIDTLLRNADGTISKLEIFHDITERKQAEIALAAEKERLAVTLRSIGDGVITTDIDGNIVLMNKIAEKLTGWSQEEATGKPFDEVFHIIHEKTSERCENPVEKVLNAGNIIGLATHTALVAKDGTQRSIADSGGPIRDRESKIIGVVLVFRDVTEQNRMEEELLKTRKLESVGVLAGGIAHDFNNILTAILGNIELATHFSDSQDQAYPLLIKAKKATLRAKVLTQQFLTFSKGGEPVKQTASIAEIITDSAGFVLHGGNVACNFNIPNDLWLVEIDKGQMSQVVQNVILNASHAMPNGGFIEVVCENYVCNAGNILVLPQGDYVKITIKDTGVGIPENLLDRIFDPFFTTKQEGSGLGLAVTHSIIIKHGGHISVESKPGIGTTVAIYLPAICRKTILEKHAEEVSPITGKGKIIVMDDEEIVRDVAKAILNKIGYEVELAKDGVEALELYKQAKDSGKPVSAVIMDLTIPGGMGGKKAVKELLAIDPEATAIVSSGYSNDPVMANYREYGFKGAIAKPYQMDHLCKALNMILS